MGVPDIHRIYRKIFIQKELESRKDVLSEDISSFGIIQNHIVNLVYPERFSWIAPTPLSTHPGSLDHSDLARMTRGIKVYFCICDSLPEDINTQASQISL